ncbi:hypothetical protein BDV93DRAFT_502782 [Ceratobasidium sp. AG-I]|nr:hypothetical protein BDV93DRAFT_502782 [Ceratobasidium sp. AG-I]
MDSLSGPGPEPLSFEVPSPFTALAFSTDSLLLAGGADGSLRVFDLSPSAQRPLCKAIRGLPDEISCIRSSQVGPASSTILGRVWIASGKQVFLFNLDSERMVIGIGDAEDVIALIEEGEGGEDNVLNEIAVSKDYIAYSCDSGSVGVVDIQTKNRRLMKAMHSNICGSLAIVPAVVSGGYDSQLIHFDAPLGSVLSKLDITARPLSSSSPISLSPPFVLSIAIDSNGALAAATADGMILVGRGGEKGRGDKSKKRKWNGLNPEAIARYRVAEGPVVGVSWVGPSEILTASLGGQIRLFRLPDPQKSVRPASDNVQLDPAWTTSTRKIDKVNGLATRITQERILHVAVGGLTSTGRGCVEVWRRQYGTNTISQ